MTWSCPNQSCYRILPCVTSRQCFCWGSTMTKPPRSKPGHTCPKRREERQRPSAYHVQCLMEGLAYQHLPHSVGKVRFSPVLSSFWRTLNRTFGSVQPFLRTSDRTIGSGSERSGLRFTWFEPRTGPLHTSIVTVTCYRHNILF